MSDGLLSPESLDELIREGELGVAKVQAAQGQHVKLKKAELEQLTHYERWRDTMHEALKPYDRTLLKSRFGGGCVSIARIRFALESCRFSEFTASDPRITDTKAVCDTIVKVLEDLGYGVQFRQALQAQRDQYAQRKKLIAPDDKFADWRQAAVKEEELATADIDVNEQLIEKIVACKAPNSELMSLEPNKRDSPLNWMIWMVHRAYLNDPTLTKFDFTNLKMPAGSEEPRIAPKLSKCLGRNTFITHFIMPNSNFDSRETEDLANSIKVNDKMQICNLDSNFFKIEDLAVLGNALGENRCISEFRCNNQHSGAPGRGVYETFAKAITANTHVLKLGMSLEDPHWRDVIDRQILQNNDFARKRNKEARDAANAAKVAKTAH